MVQENLKIAQSRQQSYVDTRRRELSFEVGYYVYLKVSPIRGVRRFGVKGKLAPWYIVLYQIQARRGEMTYQLSLPESLSAVHDVFHVSQLKSARRAVSNRGPRSPRILDIHREANLDSGNNEQSHAKEHHQNVQSQMGPSFQGRSNMRARRWSESQVSRTLCWPTLNLQGENLLWGIGLSVCNTLNLGI
jgi:hypothetical protein